jgi:DNA-directed RNA polymerase specialized sigma24 family protein
MNAIPQLPLDAPVQPDAGPTRECLQGRVQPLFLWLRKNGFDEDISWAAVGMAWSKAIAFLQDGRAFSLTCRLTWLHEIAYWSALDQVALQKANNCVDPATLEKMPRRVAPPADDAIITRVRDEVEALPFLQREAVKCVYYSGMSYRAAALEIGISASAVRARLQSAQRNLSVVLSDIAFGPKAGDGTSVHSADAS